VRLLAEEVLDPQDVVHRQVAMIALELFRQRRPADRGLAVDVRDLAQLMRTDRDAQVARQIGREQDERSHRHPFARLEREQSAHPVTDDDGRRPEPLQRRHDIFRVRVEGQLRGVGGSRPEVVLEVERVTLPTARGEVAEEPLPDPRAGELAVDEEQRLPAGAPLRQPRLDVDATVVKLDLVLPDRPTVGRRDLCPGEDLVRGRFGHRAPASAVELGIGLTIRVG
jgi:hypothetical protein